MHEPFLPQGDAAALMPGVSYSVPGLFLYSDLIYQCLEMVEAKFGYRIPVKYMYGAPQVRWNCGRLVLVDHGYTHEDLRAELRGARDHGITPLLTFSIPVVTEEDLADEKGNQLLTLLEEVRGGAIVSHPLLRNYIAEHYPHVELHASVIMTSYVEDRDPAYYESLARDHSRFVVHPDDNFEPELLAAIPKERAEIMLNERCVYRCHQRGDHYLAGVREQAAILEGEKLEGQFVDRCPFVPDFKQARTKERNATVTAPEAAELARMGFDLFKLQGRLDIPYVFFFDFLRYTLENEVAFPAFYPAFAFFIREHLKKKERRKGRGAPPEGA